MKQTADLICRWFLGETGTGNACSSGVCTLRSRQSRGVVHRRQREGCRRIRQRDLDNPIFAASHFRHNSSCPLSVKLGNRLPNCDRGKRGPERLSVINRSVGGKKPSSFLAECPNMSTRQRISSLTSCESSPDRSVCSRDETWARIKCSWKFLLRYYLQHPQTR